MVSAILLAAGESKRMGKPKQLLPLGKTTIIEQAVDNLLASRVGEIIVVLGYRADEVREKLAGKPVKIVVNPLYHEGMSTSIAAGLNLVDARAQAVMLALADQPFIDSPSIDRLLDEFTKYNRGIAIPVYRGKRGHPIIFAIKYKQKLLALKGDVGGRDIIERHPDDVLEIAVDSPAILYDIDTTSDYDACQH